MINAAENIGCKIHRGSDVDREEEIRFCGGELAAVDFFRGCDIFNLMSCCSGVDQSKAVEQQK